MTRNEIIAECLKIWNDVTRSPDERIEAIDKFIMKQEKDYPPKSVKQLLNQLKAKGVPVENCQLWNELRRY